MTYAEFFGGEKDLQFLERFYDRSRLGDVLLQCLLFLREVVHTEKWELHIKCSEDDISLFTQTQFSKESS